MAIHPVRWLHDELPTSVYGAQCVRDGEHNQTALTPVGLKVLRRMIAGCGVALILLAVGCVGESRYESIEPSSSWVEGSHQIFFFDSLESGEEGLFTIELNGNSERKLITTSIHEVVLSSDAKKIAFTKYRGDTPPCGIIDLQTNEKLAIPGPCASVDFSPSGDLLAYTNEDENYSWSKLFIYDIASRSSQLVTTIWGPIVGPRWSRDGSKLYFWGLFTEAMYVASPATMTVTSIEGVENPVEYIGAEIGLSNLHFNQYNSAGIGWFSARAPDGAGYAIVREGSLYVADPTGEEKLLLENVGSYNSDFGPRGFFCPAWTGDGRYVLGQLSEANQLVVVDVESGRAGIVTRGDLPLAYRPDYHPGEGSTLHPFRYSKNLMHGL